MPTWLVHGFRWPRVAIRIHIILENLENSAPDYIMAPASTAELTQNFQKQYPKQMERLPSLHFIEQYDPEDQYTKDQPYAYVCDQVTEIKLGVDIDEVRGVGVQSEAWTALVELRDKVAPGEKVGWFVVVNGDVERWAPPLTDDEEEEEFEDDEEVEDDMETMVDANGGGFDASTVGPASQRNSVSKPGESDPEKKTGLKKWLRKMRKSRSMKDLKTTDLPTRNASASPSVPPPVPPMPRTLRRPQTNTNGKAPLSAGTA